VDFHVPQERVDETAEVMRRLGGDVTKRFYPNMGHIVNQDEVDFVRGMMQTLISPS
jgi:predicted esterase